MATSSKPRKPSTRSAVTSTVAAAATPAITPEEPAAAVSVPPVDTPESVSPEEQRSALEAVIRASLEGKMRAEIEAEIRAEMEAAVRQEAPPAQTPAVAGPPPGLSETLTVSFVDDGLTLLGHIWYTGQELSVTRGSAEWAGTLLNPSDPESRSVLELSEDEQIARWGRRMFRVGVWAGAAYDIPDDATPEERAALLSIQQERDSRRTE